MSETKKLIEKINESEEVSKNLYSPAEDTELGEKIYSAWLDYIGDETDHDDLIDMATIFMHNLREFITDDRGELYHN